MVEAKDVNGIVLKIDDVCEYVDNSGKLWYCIVETVNPMYNFRQGFDTGLQTYIPEMWGVVIHQYWSHRLKIIGTKETHGHLLENQKK